MMVDVQPSQKKVKRVSANAKRAAAAPGGSARVRPGQLPGLDAAYVKELASRGEYVVDGRVFSPDGGTSGAVPEEQFVYGHNPAINNAKLRAAAARKEQEAPARRPPAKGRNRTEFKPLPPRGASKRRSSRGSS
jgi:hypothetical protein